MIDDAFNEAFKRMSEDATESGAREAVRLMVNIGREFVGKIDYSRNRLKDLLDKVSCPICQSLVTECKCKSPPR